MPLIKTPHPNFVFILFGLLFWLKSVHDLHGKYVISVNVREGFADWDLYKKVNQVMAEKCSETSPKYHLFEKNTSNLVQIFMTDYLDSTFVYWQSFSRLVPLWKIILNCISSQSLYPPILLTVWPIPSQPRPHHPPTPCCFVTAYWKKS